MVDLPTKMSQTMIFMMFGESLDGEGSRKLEFCKCLDGEGSSFFAGFENGADLPTKMLKTCKIIVFGESLDGESSGFDRMRRLASENDKNQCFYSVW